MRISDWSSDGCSSDLQPERTVACELEAAHHEQLHQIAQVKARGGGVEPAVEHDPGSAQGPPERRGTRGDLDAPAPHPERKSDVMGRGVSVRVQLGGSRSMRKKK